MKITRRLLAIVLWLAAASAAQGQHATMPKGMSHEEHMAQLKKEAELKKRGAAAMGFDQDAVSHHFRLEADGGRIEVVANNPADDAAIGQIRSHLKEIASAFATGDFAKPFATHDEVPPGVDTMRRLKSTIAYQYGESAGGGYVRIVTADAAALGAVHEFLRYQIREHATGDPHTVAGKK